MSKLTLSIDKDLIAAAKREAASRNTSLSQLVSTYLRIITSEQPTAKVSEEELPPATRALSGLLKGADVDLDARIDYLEKKHS